MKTATLDTHIDAVAAELAAVVGDELNDLEFSALVDEVVADRQAQLRPAFYVLVPEICVPGEYIAVYSDMSYGPATQQQLVKAGLA